MTKRRYFFLVLILGSLTALSPFSVDMYLPAFPQIARSLHTTTADVTRSLSTFFIGLAFGQLFYGLLMDRFGRKKPLYAGLAIYIAASVGCALAPSVQWLIALRFLQALGGSAVSVAPMAMVRDLFPVKASAKVYASLFMVVAASPMLAPTVGGYLTAAFGWRSIFIMLLVIAILLGLAVALTLPESHVPHPGFSLRLRPIAENFLSVAQERQFLAYGLGGMIGFAGLFAYVAGSPLVFMDLFGLSGTAYGRIFAFLSLGFIGCSQLNGLLLKRYRSEQVVGGALWGQVLVTAVFLLGALNGWFGLGGTVALIFLFLATVGITNPNASALALAPFSRNAGTASALMGAMQWGFGSLSSYELGVFHRRSLVPLAAVIFASSTLGLFVVLLGRKGLARTCEPDPAAVPAGGH